jgi:pimeloyl-ACP methyl ester carboxylesterase
MTPGRTIDLHVERRGAGRPVVLVHGLGDDHRLWRHVVPELARGHATIAIDMPGHGRSGPIPDGAPIDWFAAEVRGLIDGLALDRPVLVGLSMGGGVAQYVAIASPSLLSGLVLVSTSPVFLEPTRQRFLDRAAVAERDGMASVLDMTVDRWFTPAWAAAHPDEVETTRRTVLGTDPIQFARASRANAVRDATAGLSGIDCPVLFVAGSDDPAGPERAAAIYRASIADITVELLPGVSHLIPVEAPDRLAATLGAFLDRLDR